MAYSIGQGLASFGQSIGRGLEQRGKNKRRREFVLGRLGSIGEEKEDDYMDAVAEYEASPQGDSDQATLQAQADELQKWHKLTDDSQSTGKLEGALAEFDAEEDRQTADLQQRLLELQISSETTRGETASYNLSQRKDPESPANKASRVAYDLAKHDLTQKQDPKSAVNKAAKVAAQLQKLALKKGRRAETDAKNKLDRMSAASGLVGDFLSGTEEQVGDSREVTDPAEFETRYNKAPSPVEDRENAFNLEDFGGKQDFKMKEGWSIPRMDVQGGATSGSIGGIYNTLADLGGAVAEYGVRPLLLGDRPGRLDESYNWNVHEVTNEKLLPYLKDFKKETPGIEKLPVYRDGKVARTVPLNEENIPAENLSDFLDYANAKVAEKRAVASASARAKRGPVTERDTGEPLPSLEYEPGTEWRRQRVKTKDESTRQESFKRDKTDAEIENELKRLMSTPEVNKLTLEEKTKFKQNVETMLYGKLRKQTFGDTEALVSDTGAFQIIKKTEVASMEKAMQQATAMGMIPEEYSIDIGGRTIKFVPQQAAGGDRVKRTEQEANSYVFSSRMIANEHLLAQMEDDPNFDASSFGMYIQQFVGRDGVKIAPTNFPQIAKSQEAKAYIAAVDNWIEAALRKVSGAAIAHHEYDKYRTVFFPVVNDSKETMVNKARLRNILTKSYMENANIADINAQRSKWIHEMRTGQIWPGQAPDPSTGMARYRSEQEAFSAGAKPGERVLMWDDEAGKYGEWDMEESGPSGSTENALTASLQAAIEAGDEDEIVRILEQAQQQGR